MYLKGRPPIRVLATGFGPFPGVERNASASVVRALALSGALPGVELFAEVIPVEWTQAQAAVRRAIERARPHAILHFGVAKRATGFEIETRAVNMSGPKPDQAGVARPGRRLAHSGRPFCTRRCRPPCSSGRSGWLAFRRNFPEMPGATSATRSIIGASRTPPPPGRW